MLTHSRRRLLLPVLICLIFLLLLPLISLGEEENPFTVTKNGESSEYDFSDPDSALSYAEGYGDNLSADPDFSVHIRQAIAAIRRNTPAYATIWSLVPPLVAIVLALITKEVYASLFIGILMGGLLYANFGFEGTMVHVFSTGFVGSLSDSYNVGILMFLVLLGALVSMMNKAGGSAAFGRWAARHVRTRRGAQLCTIALGVLIFIDDYFNCLTVGSVMRPLTDRQKISRAKLSYFIDATAAPVCIIAPISSWAAAVAGFAKGAGAQNGLSLFISAIPYNFYALLTIVMMVYIACSDMDFGPMKIYEDRARIGEKMTEALEEQADTCQENPRGRVMDLVIPVAFLILACVLGMLYSGGYFTRESQAYGNFVEAFSQSDASIGLLYGSFATILFTVVFFLLRRVLHFKECMASLPEGFCAMVPAIMILTCAWTLKAMTDSLGARIFISQLVESTAGTLESFLPAMVFLIAVGLSFATGTSWGTFGILIPIVLSVFSGNDGPITIISVSACMAGAVCGDHCSPISDTTIMASAGAQCVHVVHVSTQLPYAMTVAGVSFICYLLAGYIRSWYICLPLGILLMLGTLFCIRRISLRRQKA